MDLRRALEEIRKARRSVRPAELHGLLSQAGSNVGWGRAITGSTSHPDLPYRLSIDPRNPLLPTYVSQAIRAIEEVIGNGDEDS